MARTTQASRWKTHRRPASPPPTKWTQPFKQHVVATVFSTRVLSYDGESIIVEAGGYQPMAWFLEHGSQDPIDTQEPPKKKRKTADDVPATPPAGIPVARTTIDFHFPETLTTKPAKGNALKDDVDFEGAREVSVELNEVTPDEAGTRIKLSLDMMKGAVIELEVDQLPVDVGQRLQEISRGRGSPLKALSCNFKLLRSSGQLYTVVRLEAALEWADGVSSFDYQPWEYRQFNRRDQTLKQFYPETGMAPIESLSAGTSDFYDSLHVPSKEAQHVPDVLESELYPFQKRAVAWMLGREGQSQDTVPLWSQVEDADGRPCFVSHIYHTISLSPPPVSTLSGGILAEEMGLGKTVELMALISLNKRPTSDAEDIEIAGFDKPIKRSKATLIITPPSILPQWISELTNHGPSLKVLHYEGVTSTGKNKNNKSEAELVDEICNDYDVVLITYPILGKEIHFAEDPPQRNMRQGRKYERKRSPLVLVEWWRICLDEAQMVETGVSAAARVACRLPRVNSWAVSGTPLKKNLADLQGLLIFLRLAPFNTDTKLWKYLVSHHKHLFRQLFSTIAMRHTKVLVREDLRLPPQKRIVITMPFTALEQQRYSQLFEEMCNEIGMTSDGAPAYDDWEPEEHAAAMRGWLVRLRQTCLHPQVGTHNRRALGRGQGPLRTVEEVLHVMIEQNELTTRTEERSLVEVQLTRAHVLANVKDDEHRSKKALRVYEVAMERSAEIVQDARDRLKQAIREQADTTKNTSDSDSDGSPEISTAVARLKNNVKTALALHHACVFFTANATFQIKAAEHLTPPDSDRFRDLEERETNLYETAKRVRQEILRHASERADKLTQRIKGTGTSMTKPPVLKDLESSGGIESRRVVEKSDELFDLLRDQAAVIVEWREKMAEYLSKPLVDQDEEGQETTGEEYEDSTKLQDELFAYFDAFKAMLADLNTFVTGEDAPLTDHEVKGLIKAGKALLSGPAQVLDPKDDFRQNVHAPELLLNLLQKRNEFRAQRGRVGSLRGLIQEVRQLEGNMDLQIGSARAQAEQSLAKGHLTALQSILTSFTKALEGFEKELDLFRSTQNQRLEFYRQLQELSDDVAPWKEELDEHLDLAAFEAAKARENSLTNSLNKLRTKHRFLVNLRDESGSTEGPRTCVICQGTFENGVLTVCGHQYCKECIQHWWSQHKTCPVCKRHLVTADFHNITYKPREIRAKEEEASSTSPTKPRASSSTSPTTDENRSIYTSLPTHLLSEIKSYDLPNSYGTKIDTLSRHLLWLRTHDPGAKSIVFSQYSEFLDVLASAFKNFRIGHARLAHNRATAVEKFRHDPSVDALLLDAKTDSSGLTLVEATHVFMCEPLVQTAVEAQAVARVHRIGQKRATTVWMYLVEGTVEEAVYDLSVQRRLKHVTKSESGEYPGKAEARRKASSGASTPRGLDALNQNALDAADSAELQSAPLTKLLDAGKTGGEHVQEGDLWTCLFGRPGGNSGAGSGIPVGRDGEDGEVSRFVRGEAAEMRRAGELAGVEQGHAVGGAEVRGNGDADVDRE
ncbi:hypothetical protein MBLNU230_g6128t1 [Neophaeotheca triangularis]